MRNLYNYLSRYISPSLLKFLIVGGLGTVTNLIIFFIFADVVKYNEVLISIIAFVISAVQNYILNHYWTFSVVTKGSRITFKGFLKFITVSLSALAVNLLVMKGLVTAFDLPLKVIAQAAGIFCGTLVNYIGSKLFVFKESK